MSRSTINVLKDAEDLLRQNQLDEATQIYISVLSAEPQNSLARAGLLNTKNLHLQYLIQLFNQNDIQALLLKAKRSLTFFPESFEIHNLLGGAYARQNNYDAALESYQNALEINPGSPDVYSNAAIALKELGRPEEALFFYDRAIELNPQSINAHFNRSNLLRDLKRNVEALGGYDKVIRLSPMNAGAHCNRGLVLLELGRTRESLAAIEEATKSESPSWEVYNNYGNALQNLGRLKQAAENYEIAASQNPLSAKLFYNLGKVYFQQGSLKKAISKFELANQVNSRGQNSVTSGLASDIAYKDSNSFILRSLYQQDDTDSFHQKYDLLVNSGENNSTIGSLGCQAEKKYGLTLNNPFCSNPLDFAISLDMHESCDFKKLFVTTVRQLIDENYIEKRIQPLLENGWQSSGNLFLIEHTSIEQIKKILELQIADYQRIFQNSDEGFIRAWPKKYSLVAWLVSMRSGGKLRPHMHDNGWLSGSVYIHIPDEIRPPEGSLVVSLDENEFCPRNKTKDSKVFAVTTGTLCLFPASLYHHTLPFESDDERLVLAFDVVPE